MRLGLRWLTCLALSLAVLAADFAIGATTASAQERVRRPGLLQGLFQRGERVERQAVRPAARRQRPARRKPTRRKKATAAVRAPKPVPQIVQKAENARTILVVGDFLGGGLAEGLETVFFDAPDIRVVDRTNGSSGFVRNDFYDWPGEIGAMLDADKPSAVVVMIGSNDRQEIGSHAVRSPGWTAQYEARIKNFTTSISQRNIPLVWVGMPAFKSSSMSSDMLAFNDIYRGAAEGTGSGVFVDIWDGFVDESGNFSARGPDINGQPVQLRSSDGINLTRDGRRKVAFYVEKPLDRILGDAASPQLEVLGPEMPLGLTSAPLATPEVNRTVPISLNDPELDGGVELLGATGPIPNGTTPTPAERLATEGVAAAPPPGRADDFLGRSPPRPAAAAATAPEAAEAGPVVVQ